MKEQYKLRVRTAHLGNLFGALEGHDLGSIRVVTIAGDDPRIGEITQVQRRLHKRGDMLVVGFEIIRSYSEEELLQSEWLRMVPTSFIQSCGEECTTIYDDTVACGFCGWGAAQVNRLSLPPSKVPIGPDLGVTWAGEWVVSGKFAEVFEGLVGSDLDLMMVSRCRTQLLPIADRFQLVARETPFELVPPTTVRDHLIENEGGGENVCPLGHNLGLNVISELYVRRLYHTEVIICRTTNGFGARRGLLRPGAPWLVNQEFYRKFINARLIGAKFEVVHLR